MSLLRLAYPRRSLRGRSHAIIHGFTQTAPVMGAAPGFTPDFFKPKSTGDICHGPIRTADS
jgi:hypothetical protein